MIDLVRRLAAHSSDREIAIVLSNKAGGARPGCRSPNGASVASASARTSRPRRAAALGTGVSISQAARQLGVSTPTIRRWLAEGLLPAEQTAEHAPGGSG